MDCKDETMGRNLTLILNQTLRGKNLTRNLVAFAKSQEPKQKYFRINEKIDLVLNLMKKDLEAIDVRVEHGPAIPDLLADPGMIEHALVNLVQNAIHAVGRIKDPVIIVRTYCRENHIWCEIRDNGCGIPSQYLKAIFEPSFTLKGSRDVIGAYKSGVKGSGYGMANTKKYIDQHNGTIRVESLVDSGTQFTISLPIIHRELSVQEKNQLENQPHFFEKQILLVEDEPAISEVQYRILTQEPCRHRVDLADNGQAAMALLDKNRYDLISLDYVLPGGVNGMDVYRHIRKTNKRIPILFVSGNIEFLESIQGLMNEDPHLDHLSKPCKNMDYINGLNRLMNETRD
jgi:CheY-like chemotaxis protein